MKNRVKAILALLLAMACLFSYAACDTDDGNDNSSATDAMTQSGEVSDGSELISEILSSDESSEEESGPSLTTVPLDTYSDTAEDGSAKRDPNYKTVNYDVMRGIWLDQYSMKELYCSGTKQIIEKTFTTKIQKVCKGIAKAGFNTIIVQVRPNGDSFYPSEYYAPSSFVVGGYGGEFQYDMLKIFVEYAHLYGLSFHAWVNPMRLMKPEELNVCDDEYTLTQWYKDAEQKKAHMSQSGNLLYLVPGVEENRQLVWNGVTEICTNYNVDAVHIDDYFYPTVDSGFDDVHWQQVKADYEITGIDTIDRRAYRLEMVNILVKGMHDAVKAVDPTLWFGISPAGNIGNNTNALFADVHTWCGTPGYCDYIVPQVYWGFEHPTPSSRFDVCSTAWMDITCEEVRLVIGVGIYRILDKTDSDFAEYKEHDDVTKRQLEYLQSMDKNDGFVFYTYDTMFNGSGSLSGIVKERKNFLPVLQEFGGDAAYTVVSYEAETQPESSEAPAA